MPGQPFRIAPKMSPSSYKTYALARPKVTHSRPATCAEVECEAYLNGWRTVVDMGTELGQEQAHYLRKLAGRRYAESGNGPGGNLVTFTFEAGQQCFAEHTVPLEREPLYIVRDGDWRQSTGAVRKHAVADDWVDDFATHQDKLSDEIKKG